MFYCSRLLLLPLLLFSLQLKGFLTILCHIWLKPTPHYFISFRTDFLIDSMTTFLESKKSSGKLLKKMCPCCQVLTNCLTHPTLYCHTHMFHHSVLQILPPLLAFFCVREDVCGGAVRWAFSQLLPIILHQGGPAHQLHGGELFQKVPKNERRG